MSSVVIIHTKLRSLKWLWMSTHDYAMTKLQTNYTSIINCCLFVDTDKVVYLQGATQYHVQPNTNHGIGVLSVDKSDKRIHSMLKRLKFWTCVTMFLQINGFTCMHHSENRLAISIVHAISYMTTSINLTWSPVCAGQNQYKHDTKNKISLKLCVQMSLVL